VLVATDQPDLAVVTDKPAVAGLVQGSGFLAARTQIPASPVGTVRRRCLCALLERGVAGVLTVVSAGPGWGKTCAVSDWAANIKSGRTVAWLSLAPHDDSLTAFWSAVLSAFRATGDVPRDHPVADLSPVDEMSATMLQLIYNALLSLPTRFVLVLDDFQLIRDVTVLESIAPLLSRGMPVKLVLISRSDPVLPLHRLRISGELTEIDAEDLGFQRGELALVTAAAGLQVNDADLDRIYERTDGWPAGVRLAILHLSRRGVVHDLSDFGGKDRSVAEYLVAEVMDGQPPELREFLMQTSVVDLICADLADAIVTRGRSIHDLELLERSNQFVTALGRERRWYRYHPLLREMLEHSLERDEPDRFRAAHARAAGWLAWHGEPVAALRHAVSAADWTLFSTIFVESACPAILGPDRHILTQLLAAVPFDDLPPTAALTLCAWALSFLEERLSATPEHVAAARVLLPSTPDLIRPAVSALLEIVACTGARATSDAPTIVRAANAALNHLQQASRPFPALHKLQAVATNNLAVGMLWSGQTQAAPAVFRAAADDALSVGLFPPAINALAHLGLCELIEGRFDEADKAAQAALDMAEPRGLTSRCQLRCAYITRAYIDVLHGDTAAAHRQIAAATAAVDGGNEPAPALASYLCQALAAISYGRLRAAERALSRASTTALGWDQPAFLDDWFTRAATEAQLLNCLSEERVVVIEQLRQAQHPSATVQACLARLLLADGDVHGAESLARTTCASIDVDSGVDVLPLIETLLVRSLAADHLRRDGNALDHLVQAIDVAQPQWLLRPFLVTGSSRMPNLIRDSLDYAHPQPIALQLLSILGNPGPATPEPEPLHEPLTERELTMLAALPGMHTNAEIADRLFVSVNTVKAHIKGLYRKLDVNNRRDAMRRGHELGLLPSPSYRAAANDAMTRS
jgi:LuxR family transcriptional regulator, maltose regulon positive regulatory protein